MAAPMQQMPGQLIPQQQNRFGVGSGGQGMDFGHYAFQFIQSTPYIGAGWQTSVAITERVGKAQDLITSAILATPSQPWQRLAHLCVQFEQNAFRESPDRATYHQKMRQKTAEMHARRRGQTQQAAINQSQIAGSSSEPNQAGLQHLSNPTQVSQIPQQAHPASHTGSNAKSDGSKPFSVSNDDKQMAQQHHPNQPNGINHSRQRLGNWRLDAKSLAGIVNKDTISKDNTISEEAQEAILLAYMARKINRMTY